MVRRFQRHVGFLTDGCLGGQTYRGILSNAEGGLLEALRSYDGDCWPQPCVWAVAQIPYQLCDPAFDPKMNDAYIFLLGYGRFFDLLCCGHASSSLLFLAILLSNDACFGADT